MTEGGVNIHGFNIKEYKDYEEETTKEAINSLLHFTAKEAVLHGQIADKLKSEVVASISNLRVQLSDEKQAWLAIYDNLKKG